METKTLVIITAYNRLKSLTSLVKELHKQDPKTDIVIFDDHSPETYKPIADNIQVFRNPEHYGKHGYWKTYQAVFDYVKAHEYDYYIFLPDDVEVCPDFVANCITNYEKADCICLSPMITNRSFLHGMSRYGWKQVTPTDWGFMSHYFDCCGIVKRDFFEALK